MFGLNEALMSFIQRQVGLRTDGGSSTGSLHAKVKDVRDNLISQANSIKSTLQKPRGNFVKGSGYCEDGWATLLNTTGKGTLLYVWFGREAGGIYGQVRITIDGVVLGSTIMNKCGTDDVYNFCGVGVGKGGIFTGPLFSSYPLLIDFKQSLKIEGTRDGTFGTNRSEVYWLYVKE